MNAIVYFQAFDLGLMKILDETSKRGSVEYRGLGVVFGVGVGSGFGA